MFGKKEKKVSPEANEVSELEQIQTKSKARVQGLIEANNHLVEDVRDWKQKFQALLTEHDIFKAGAVSHTQVLEDEITKLKKKVGKLEKALEKKEV